MYLLNEAWHLKSETICAPRRSFLFFCGWTPRKVKCLRLASIWYQMPDRLLWPH